MNIGYNIKRLREEKGITQKELSERVFITQSMLCQIELGRKNPSLQVGLDIAKALGCEVEDFMGNAG